jgi:hypothetical protein
MEPEKPIKPQCGLSKAEYKQMKKEKRAQEKSSQEAVCKKIVAPEIVIDGGAAFDEEKQIVFDKIALNSQDKSRAGELDEAILPFVGMLPLLLLFVLIFKK